MLTNEEQFRLSGSERRFSIPSGGMVGKILATVVSAAVLVVTFMLSLVIFAGVVAIALIAIGYVWWRTRGLRADMRDRRQGGRVIDGLATREEPGATADKTPASRQ